LISIPREVTAGVHTVSEVYLMRCHVISSRPWFLVFLLLLLLLAACGQSSTGTTAPVPTSTPTPVVVDAYGTPIVYPSTTPQRIISLVPTTSDMLAALNLDSRVVAVDSYTDYPADLKALPKISTNGQYNIEQIVALKPDLVLSYGAATKQYDSQMVGLGLRVVDLPPGNLTQILQELLTVGRLTFTQEKAGQVVNQLQQQINQVKAAVAGTTAPSVLLELDDSTPGHPYVYGGSSYGDELVQDANGVNIFHDNTSGGGYPQVTDEAIIHANPQFVIVTEKIDYGVDVSSVYKRPNWSGIDALKMHHVYQIGPSLIAHPGPRLVQWLRCLAQTLHPEKFSDMLPDYCAATD
jgi:iron complex transport system substrate-binding protein